MTTLVHPAWAPEAGAPRLSKGELPLGRSLLVWLVLPLVVLAFIISGPMLRLVDPFAASPDIGILGLLVFGLLSGLAMVIISRWLLELLWPVFREFRKHHLEPIFKSLLPWKKLIIYLACYFLLLYALVVCLAAVF
jgi:hypothetical protein